MYLDLRDSLQQGTQARDMYQIKKNCALGFVFFASYGPILFPESLYVVYIICVTGCKTKEAKGLRKPGLVEHILDVLRCIIEMFSGVMDGVDKCCVFREVPLQGLDAAFHLDGGFLGEN